MAEIYTLCLEQLRVEVLRDLISGVKLPLEAYLSQSLVFLSLLLLRLFLSLSCCSRLQPSIESLFSKSARRAEEACREESLCLSAGGFIYSHDHSDSGTQAEIMIH